MNSFDCWLLAAITMIGGPTASAAGGNPVKVKKVSCTVLQSEALQQSYLPTTGDAVHQRAVSLRRAAASGLTAAFSVQGDDAQVSVWEENFDTNELDGWIFDQGEGSVVSFTKKKSDFETIDPSDVYSLFIDGPYQVYKRTKASATTASKISVPANGVLHAFIKMSSIWNEYVTLALQVSADGFATTTELWNSRQVTDAKSQWVKIDADLAAFAGKEIQLRLFWGPGTNDTFNTGGYMGDFYVDGLSVTGVGTVDNVKVKTGEVVQLADMSTGNPVKWEWSFPGGVPESSSERNPKVYYPRAGSYDVSLTVTDAAGAIDQLTRQGFVSVEGQIPTAGVRFPAEFRDLQTRMRMIAPLAPVSYRDASEGFPTEVTWTFYTPYDLAKSSFFVPDTVYTTPDVDYCHNTLGKCWVLHTAQNEEGYTWVDDSVQVQFQGLVSNFTPKDGYQTNFTDGDLTLPGANRMGITAWAERISKPSVPVVLEALYVNFTKAVARELTDQIAGVSFSLYTSADGLPGEPVALLDTWTMSELSYAMTSNKGTVPLQLDRKYVIDDECFIVIDGIPEKNDSLECAIAMAPMRDFGNTAYMLNKGRWRPFTGYLQAAPGGQTSLAVFPYFTHSVVLPAQVSGEGAITMGSDTLRLPATAGKTEALVFANRGIARYLGSSADWCRVVGLPGDYNVDTLHVEFDALPEHIERREATLSVTDSVTTLHLYVVQDRSNPAAIYCIALDNDCETEVCYDLQGRQLDGRKSRGIYLQKRGNRVEKRFSR